MRFRRALDRSNVTEVLSAASELGFIGLAEALELTLLLADTEPEKFDRAAVRWRVRFVLDSKNVDLRESLAVLALLAAIPVNRLASLALAELLSRGRGMERPARHLSPGREGHRTWPFGSTQPRNKRVMWLLIGGGALALAGIAISFAWPRPEFCSTMRVHVRQAWLECTAGADPRADLTDWRLSPANAQARMLRRSPMQRQLPSQQGPARARRATRAMLRAR
jgi:hypothetical protein